MINIRILVLNYIILTSLATAHPPKIPPYAGNFCKCGARLSSVAQQMVALLHGTLVVANRWARAGAPYEIFRIHTWSSSVNTRLWEATIIKVVNSHVWSWSVSRWLHISLELQHRLKRYGSWWFFKTSFSPSLVSSVEERPRSRTRDGFRRIDEAGWHKRKAEDVSQGALAGAETHHPAALRGRRADIPQGGRVLAWTPQL